MIPIGDETPTRRTPVVTWSLIAANVVVFGLCWTGGPDGFAGVIKEWGFVPAHFSPVTLFTSMFLHGGIFHIVGNMLYLWIFGDNVEDVLGHLGFFAFYVSTGLAAGIAHFFTDTASMTPVVGASGAISGVLGAYILLFPRSRIRVLWWFYWYVRVFMVEAGWLLAFYFAFQVVFAITLAEYSNVAYWAHIGGFAAGLAVTLVLLSLSVISKPERPGLQDIAAGRAGGALGEGGRRERVYSVRSPGRERQVFVATRVVDSGTLPADAGERVGAILAAISAGETDKAIASTQLELRLPPKHAADPVALTGIADAFYRQKVYPMAFNVYEVFINRADAGDARLPEVEFRAGIIASRHLRDFVAARRLLEDVVLKHGSDERRRTAEKELAEIEKNLARTGIDENGGLLTGPCAVIRQTSGMVNVAQVGRIVAKATGRPLADITRLVRGSVGFVATGLEARQAKAVASQLQEIDIPVLVIPEEKLVALPTAKEVSWAAVTEGGVEFASGEGPAVAKKWDEIFYASLARVSFTSRKRVVDDLGSMGPTHYAPLGMGHGAVAVPMDGGPSWKYTEVKTVKLVFDLFTLNPFECYRCIDGKMDFRGSPQAVTASSALNFRRFIGDFVAYGREVPVNEGVSHIVAKVPENRWRQLTFDSIGNLERYNYWRLQLEQYG